MKYTKELLEPIVKECTNYSEVLRKLGRGVTGGDHVHIKKAINRLGLSTEHFQRKSYSKVFRTDEEILSYNSLGREDGKLLRNILIRKGIKYCCSKCSIDSWQNEPITLHVDHIDGNWRNNTIENLRFLCPNCHSQTSTYGSKRLKKNVKIKLTVEQKIENKKIQNFKARKVEWPSKELLYKLIWSIPSYEIAKQYGVSDKAIGNWCRHYKISKPPRGYWTKIKNNMMQ